jgi:carbon-monoxide dehydrogenase large subunit
VVGGGGVWGAGGRARRRTLAELAGRHGDEEPRLRGDATFEAGLTYDFGAHIAVVRLDPELGTVALERLVVAFDVGRAINPTIVEGQLAGAAAQGVGGVLLEELRHDDHGNPVTTSLMDYLLPTAKEIPTLDVIIDELAPARENPLGAKGVGEAGIIGVAAAVAGAVSHAAGDAGLVRTTPILPASIAIR